VFLPLAHCFIKLFRMTKRNILSFQEAQQALAPYYDKLANAVLEGFNDYLKVHNCAAEE